MASDRGGFAVIVMAAVPLLALQAGAGYLRFEVRWKRSVRMYRKALLGGGLRWVQAVRLAQTYHDAGSVRQILRGAGVSGLSRLSVQKS